MQQHITYNIRRITTQNIIKKESKTNYQIYIIYCCLHIKSSHNTQRNIEVNVIVNRDSENSSHNSLYRNYIKKNFNHRSSGTFWTYKNSFKILWRISTNKLPSLSFLISKNKKNKRINIIPLYVEKKKGQCIIENTQTQRLQYNCIDLPCGLVALTIWSWESIVPSVPVSTGASSLSAVKHKANSCQAILLKYNIKCKCICLFHYFLPSSLVCVACCHCQPNK